MSSDEKAVDVVAETLREDFTNSRGLAEEIVHDLDEAGLTVVDRADLDQARDTARRALALARRLLNTHATERKGGPLVSRLSSGEFTARMNELAALERELG